MQTIVTTKPGHSLLTPAEHVVTDAIGDFLNEVYSLGGLALAQPAGLNLSSALDALAQAEGWA